MPLFAAAGLDPVGKLLALSPDVQKALSLLQCRIRVSPGAQWIAVDTLCLCALVLLELAGPYTPLD